MAASTLETYTKKTSQGTDVVITVLASPAGSPVRPTCLLLGWYGSSRRNLAKYASVYRAMGYNTAQTAAPTSVVFSFTHASMRPFLLSILRMLRADTRLVAGGLVIAAFSNGGACLLPGLSQLFETAPPPTGAAKSAAFPAVVTTPALSGADLGAIAAVRDHLSAVICDSCPCYMHAKAGADALVQGAGLSGRPYLAAVVSACFRALCLLQLLLVGNMSAKFWAGVRDARYPCPELYMYSAADKLLDEVALDEMVEHRKRGAIGDVRVWRVEDAPHVQLLTAHPSAYVRQVRRANDWGVNAWRKRAGMPQWTMPAGDGVDDRA
jgi:hypothetical protein